MPLSEAVKPHHTEKHTSHVSADDSARKNILQLVTSYVQNRSHTGLPPSLIGNGAVPKTTPRRRGDLAFPPARKRLDFSVLDKKLEVVTEQDETFDSPNIHKLTNANFHDFLKTKDITLVMFYYPYGPDTEKCALHLSAASGITNRENHAYAAVNCTEEPELCAKEEMQQIDTLFRLYSKDAVVGTIRLFSTFTFDIMKRFVEQAPLLDEYRRPTFPCAMKKKK